MHYLIVCMCWLPLPKHTCLLYPDTSNSTTVILYLQKYQHVFSLRDALRNSVIRYVPYGNRETLLLKRQCLQILYWLSLITVPSTLYFESSPPPFIFSIAQRYATGLFSFFNQTPKQNLHVSSYHQTWHVQLAGCRGILPWC